MLRLDWNIVFNIINLLILYLLMKRFLFQPVRNILEKRQAEADSSFAQADQKEALAEACHEKYETLLLDAENERETIVAQARTDASKEYERIVDEARKSADQIVASAKTDAEKEKSAILQQADREIRELILTAAAKIAGESAGAENDRRLYDRFLNS